MTKARKEQIAQALVLMPTTKQVIEACKVSANTLTRLRRDDEFQYMVEEIRRQVFEAAINRAAAESAAAVERLARIAKDAKNPAGARVAADKALLSFALDNHTDAEIRQKIEALRLIIVSLEEKIEDQTGVLM